KTFPYTTLFRSRQENNFERPEWLYWKEFLTMKKGKSKSSSNTWRLVSLQLCRFSIPMPEKLRFRREIVPIIQLMALLQSFLEKYESIFDIICLYFSLAFNFKYFYLVIYYINF